MVVKAFPHLRAVIYVSAGTAVYALILASSKLTGGTVELGPIMFLRYFGSVLTLAVFLVLRGLPLGLLLSQQWKLHLLRTFCAAGGIGAVIYAAAHMPILDAAAISMLHVIVSMALGIVVLGERVSLSVVAGAALSAAGAALTVFSSGAFGSESVLLLPAGAAVFSALLFAFDGFLLNILSRRDSPLATLGQANAFALALTLVPCMLWWSHMSPWSIALLVSFGPLALAGQYLIFKGYVAAPLSVVAPIDYSLMISSCLVGLMLFDEVPGWGSLVGSATIATGALLVSVARGKSGHAGSIAHARRKRTSGKRN